MGGPARPSVGGLSFSSAASEGKFIVDFACTKHRLIVEADGAQHADSQADQRRTALLEGEGWRVVRFWDNDVLTNTEGVIQMILDALQER